MRKANIIMNHELQTKITQLEKELATVKELAKKCDNQEYRKLEPVKDDSFVLMDGRDQYSHDTFNWSAIEGHTGEMFGNISRKCGGYYRTPIITETEIISKYNIDDFVVYNPKNITYGIHGPVGGRIYQVKQNKGHIYGKPIISVQLNDNVNTIFTFQDTEFRPATHNEILAYFVNEANKKGMRIGERIKAKKLKDIHARLK